MIEPERVAAFRRELRALVAYAGNSENKHSDPESFALVVRLLDEAQLGLYDAAEHLNEQGFSWEAIGQALGISRQAAYKRFVRNRRYAA